MSNIATHHEMTVERPGAVQIAQAGEEKVTLG